MTMSRRDEVRDFLVSRRANVTLAQAGLPDLGHDRRVPGLRREEVAMLAGVSVDYYTRLERGNVQGASDSVLHAVARALRLSDIEREHLLGLARPARLVPAERTPTMVRASVQRILDALTVPAVVYDARQDLLASNLLGRALFSLHFEADRPNFVRFVFLDSRAVDFYEDWPLACSLTAAMLRFEAGRDPLNADITALIGELATLSPQFRMDWADHDVHEHRTGRKTYRHPVVGALELTYEVFEMPGQPGLSIGTYVADEGSPSADAMTLLATWAATRESEAGLAPTRRAEPPRPIPRRVLLHALSLDFRKVSPCPAPRRRRPGTPPPASFRPSSPSRPPSSSLGPFPGPTRLQSLKREGERYESHAHVQVR